MVVKGQSSTRSLDGRLKTNADGYVFQLHYRATTIICFVACVVLLAATHVGRPIHCLGDRGEEAAEMVSAYCWNSPSYSLGYRRAPADDLDIAHPGMESPFGEKVMRINYYKWIPFFLIISGFFFYLPHVIWRLIEGKSLEHLLQAYSVWLLDADSAKKNIGRHMQNTRGKNCIYAFPYLLCEILCLVNVIAQLVIMDKIVGGFFWKHGTEVISQVVNSGTRYGALKNTFPWMLICTLHLFGSDGELDIKNMLCVYPQNYLNEIVFMVMWFWFIVLATITAAQLILTILMYLSPHVRLGMLQYRGKLNVSQDIEKSVAAMSFGDFFLLHLLARHLDAVTFGDVVTQVCSSESLYPFEELAADSML